MSSHSGVSCDSCTGSNFPGRRYKCLVCDNYDLCGKCFDTEAESQNHKNNHPMQCTLTEAAAELFYAGEQIPRRTVVSLTCPHCGQGGFVSRTLLAHCVEKHSSASPQVKNVQGVMCPICVTTAAHRGRSRFALLADHIATAHGNGQAAGGDEESILSPFVLQTRRTGGNEDGNSDEEEVEEDEEDAASLNDLEHRAFVEEEQRRQETTRQRLAHVSSLAASARSEYAAALAAYHNSNAQRRAISRQTAVRIPRGGLRSHYSNFPYGTMPRTTPALPNSGTLRAAPPEASTTNTSQNTNNNDALSAAFSQDPMLEFVSQLMNNQSSSPAATGTTSASSAQFVFGPSNPTQRPPATSNSALEFARLQQQIENNETMAQIKSSLLHAKQKRTSQSQQQASSSSSVQPVILNHPSGHDYHLWQQQLPNMQPSTNSLSFLGPNVPNDAVGGNATASTAASRQSCPSQRENDPRSLLGKMLRKDQTVNRSDTNDQVPERVSFTHSLLLSTLIASRNDEQEETSLTVNKENHL